VSGGSRDLSTLVDVVEPARQGIDEGTAARARAVVSARARDREDRRLLLDVLGLGERSD
jgi:hypothetical protein